MATEKTKVEFDVLGAITSLAKLEKKSRETGNEVKGAFEAGGEGTKFFAEALDAVDPKLATFVASVGTAGAGVALAVGSVATLAANLLGVAESLRDVDATFEGIIERSKDVKESLQLRENLSGAKDDFDLSLRREELAFKRTELTKTKAANSEAQRRAEDQLEFAKDTLAKVDEAEKSAAKNSRSAAEKLQDFQDKKVGDNQGNASKNIEEGLKRDAELAEQKQKALKGQKSEAQNLVDAMETLLEIEKNRGVEIRSNSKLLAEQQRIVSLDAGQGRQEGNARKAELLFEETRKNIQGGAKSFAEQGTLGKLKDNFSAGLRGVLSPTSLGSIPGGAKALSGIEKAFQDAVIEVFRDGKVTTGEVEGLEELRTKLKDQIGIVKTKIGEGTGSDTLTGRVGRIEKLVNELAGFTKAGTLAAGAGLGPDQGIATASQSVRQNQAARNAARGDTSAAVNQTINLNVDVKGGIIDADVAKQIGEIAATEFRKGTAK